MSVNQSVKSGGIIRIFFFFNMKVCCAFLLESLHLGDSDEYTQCTIFYVTKKIPLNYLKSAAMGFFRGTQERVRNSRG